MRPQQAPVSGKVFIQRDYSGGTRCQFQSKFPAELENRVRRVPAVRAGPGAARSSTEARPVRYGRTRFLPLSPSRGCCATGSRL